MKRGTTSGLKLGIWNTTKRMRRVAIDRYNREAPVDFLRKCREKVVELQGIGDGDFAEAPKAHENIAAEGILDSFRFKERGFYKVAVKRVSDSFARIARDRPDR